MRFDRTFLLRVLSALYAVMWVGGMLRVRDGGWAAPAFLLLAGAIALLSDRSGWKALLRVAAIGFGCEVIGVYSGFPFGRYHYTGTLGPALAGVPIAIACAWLVMFAFVRQFNCNLWVSAALLTATDLVIDPIASGTLLYWRWLTPGPYFGVPLSNFAGWFAVSVLLFWLHPGPVAGNWRQRVLGASMLVFFAARFA